MEQCWICGKKKGQPPDRCPGHYELLESSSASPACSVTGSPWQRVNRVMDVAEKLDWLVKMKMEAPGCTREEAEAWAEARLAEAGIDIHS